MPARRLIAAGAAALLAVTTLAACGDDTDPSAAPTTAAAEQGYTNGTSDTPGADTTAPAAVECSDDVTTAPDASKKFGSEPAIAKPEGPPPCELVVEDLTVGKGKAVTDLSKKYTWNYEGVSWSTGEVFDSSFERGAPIPFSLDQVIDGWTEGLQGIKPGGRRILVIPSEQAYGEVGSPPAIGPNETLVFVVDLVEAT